MKRRLSAVSASLAHEVLRARARRTGWCRKWKRKSRHESDDCAEGRLHYADRTSDKDPNYEWARMELEKAQVQVGRLRAGVRCRGSGRIAATGAQQMQFRLGRPTGSDAHGQADEDNYLSTCTSARKRALATRSTAAHP